MRSEWLNSKRGLLSLLRRKNCALQFMIHQTQDQNTGGWKARLTRTAMRRVGRLSHELHRKYQTSLPRSKPPWVVTQKQSRNSFAFKTVATKRLPLSSRVLLQYQLYQAHKFLL